MSRAEPGERRLDDATTAFLHTGCALIVATVAPDGEPRASRGWGVEVAGPTTVRLLLDASDVVTNEHLLSGRRIAITATDVRTLRSLQLKGPPSSVVEPATALDVERSERYCALFFDDVCDTDGTPRWKLERLVPVALAACLVEVDEMFDQTPGPRAGTAFTGQ
jgi:hypothetical protein